MQKKKKNVRGIISEKFKNIRSISTRRESAEETQKKATNNNQTAIKKEQISAVSEKTETQVKEKQVQAAAPSRTINELPWNYGDNLIYLMIRDPYWIYAYWEIQQGRQENALKSLGGDWGSVKSVLRVYDATDSENNSYFDITLQGMADHWFVNVGANRSYYIEIGLLHRDGRFVVLARSNRVTTPRDGMSDVLDEQWMGIDFDKLYALSGGFELGKSSLELKKMMQERLQKAVSSGSGAAVSSFASPVKKIPKLRKFWFVLDCELIVYGATEPDAAVTLQGRDVKLRPDGTFSLRFALPDGRLVLDAAATSADGVERRKIIPVVERNTTSTEPEFLKPF